MDTYGGSLVLIVALALISIAVGMLWLARCIRRSVRMPHGQVIFVDKGSWESVDEVLFDSHLGLVGRPDYVIRNGEEVIPIEIKSGRTPQVPYENHVYQLGAYCLLVHRTGVTRPSYGLIHYKNKTFKVDFTDALEQAVLTLLAQLKKDIHDGCSDRSHEILQRCKNCAYHSMCDQRIELIS